MKAIVCAIAILAFFTTVTAKDNLIRGRVVINQTPVPIANATVILDSVTPNQQVITNTGGEFEFHVKPGRHRVKVLANNYVPTQHSFLVSENYSFEIGMNLQTAITAPNQRVVAARVQDSISYYNVEESSLVRLSQSTMLIVADEESKLKFSVFVMDVCKQIGIERFAIAEEKI